MRSLAWRQKQDAEKRCMHQNPLEHDGKATREESRHRPRHQGFSEVIPLKRKSISQKLLREARLSSTTSSNSQMMGMVARRDVAALSPTPSIIIAKMERQEKG